MEQETFTLGRIRTHCIENIRQILRNDDVNNHHHLKIENDRYYDTLPDDSDAKKHLTKEWDNLSSVKNNQLKQWKKSFDAADSMDKHDWIERRKHILYNYENERRIHVENNYHYYKTYMEQSMPSYPLE